MAHEPVKDTDPTIGRLVSDASRDISSLITNEIKLAKSELQVSIKAGGLGIGLFAAAGFFALMSLIMLSVAIAYFINWNGKGLSLSSSADRRGLRASAPRRSLGSSAPAQPGRPVFAHAAQPCVETGREAIRPAAAAGSTWCADSA
jgi:hypothetical protein